MKPKKYRSKFEKAVHEHTIRHGRDAEYEPDGYYLNYAIPSRYIPDFRLDSGVLVETKGYLGPRDRAKMRQVKASNPTADIRFVFQRANNRISKSANSMMYWQWCEKHGFPWAEGAIPEEWFKNG